MHPVAGILDNFLALLQTREHLCPPSQLTLDTAFQPRRAISNHNNSRVVGSYFGCSAARGIRAGTRSLKAGIEPARRRTTAPTALAGGLGNPGPTVQSRNCPSLLLARCSRRSCGFVVAGAARVAGVLLGKRSGSGPAGVRGGSRNALCLQGGSAAFRMRRSLGCGCGPLFDLHCYHGQDSGFPSLEETCQRAKRLPVAQGNQGGQADGKDQVHRHRV